MKILNTLLRSKRYANGNIKVALCMYNAGPSRCRFSGVQWRGSNYSRKVLKTAKKFRERMIEFDLDPDAEDEVF